MGESDKVRASDWARAGGRTGGQTGERTGGGRAEERQIKQTQQLNSMVAR